MKLNKIQAALAVTLVSVTTSMFAGGPLYIHEGTMQPYKWNTSKGSIPVYTDGGPVVTNADGSTSKVFTFNVDGSAFLTIEQANSVTTKALAEWTNVATSTLDMSIQGTIEDITGIADVNETNASQIYGTENGYGFFINYDTDGKILEEYFGIPKTQVLGIAFPEWADEETGEITEATALLNGWFVDASDTEGEMVAGVFTHEFGHALNMSHSQANGHFTYMAARYRPYSDGVEGCDGVTTWVGRPRPAADTIETMFPFINVQGDAGRQQSTINVRDDIVNISDLYPTADYQSQYGTITGTLYLKDGKTEYSGINMVARNLDDPLYDVITQQSGNMTQGMIGPDGKYTINGLVPGGRYVLYTDTIKAGGYPTTPTPLVSQPEYWDEGEGTNPALDNQCAVTPIVAEAGKTTQADMYFNGYQDGIQYTPLVQAHITDMSKNGKRAMGMIGAIPFLYDAVNKDFQLHPEIPVKALSGVMNKNATKAAVVIDLDGNGIGEPAIWNLSNNKVTSIGSLGGDTCGGSGSTGKNSATVWDMDDTGRKVVGLAYVDFDGNGICQKSYSGEMIPFLWDAKDGMQALDISNYTRRAQWIRAERISGNGEVVLGSNTNRYAIAWVNGEMRDLATEINAQYATAVSQDGKTVAVLPAKIGRNFQPGLVLWDHSKEGADAVREIGSLTYCVDMPYNHFFFGDLCSNPRFGAEFVQGYFGSVAVLPLDMNDDATMITGRAGSFFTGFKGAIYLEGLGWMTTDYFFRKQGVVEVGKFPADNPIALSGNGSEMMANIAGLTITFDVDMNKAFVCENGIDKEVSFPKQLIAEVKAGAEFGRCAHLND